MAKEKVSAPEAARPRDFTAVGAENFIITRKRKKYRFARFNELPNCFHLSEWVELKKMDYRDEPGNDVINGKLIVEVGAGSAGLSVELARRHPENTYVALDLKSDRLYQGARDADEEGLNNIFFVRARAEDLRAAFRPGSVDDVWLTFSDPYPKKGDVKHRLTYKTYLKIYAKILRPGGRLHFKTDNTGLFEFSIESLSENGWTVRDVTRDFHASDLPDEYKIMTTYEKKFVSAGETIKYLSGLPEQVR